MSKAISVILVLVLFFGPAINSFAETSGSSSENAGDSFMTIIYIGAGIFLVILALGWVVGIFRAEAEAPDDGVRMVSSENEISTEKIENKTILNVFQHVEAGVTPNKNIYVGLRFQY
jgi:intracellular sulfur oxidation DsrE/DsrF family protein